MSTAASIVSSRTQQPTEEKRWLSPDGTATWLTPQLDEDSSVLASKLQAEGVGLGSVVASCFSKSLWAVVTMLAVLKAGGAFVYIDPKQPGKRQLDCA